MKHLLVLIFILFLSGCAGMVISKNETIIRGAGEYGSSKEVLLNKLGEPDEIIIINNGEEWLYKEDLHFSGGTVVIGVPLIPLYFPTGYHYSKYIFRKDQETQLEIHQHLNLSQSIRVIGWVCVERCDFVNTLF